MTQTPSPMSKRAAIAAALTTAAVAAALLCIGLATSGIWEPWEAREILDAIEYGARPAWDASVVQSDPRAPGYNWAVPTSEGAPIARSLLKTWLVELAAPAQVDDVRRLLGALEWRTRAPIALGLLLTILATFAWIARWFGARAALFSGLALATMPAVYLGARSLATESLFIVTHSLALIAFMQMSAQTSRRARALYAALYGVALSATFLDQRLVGVGVVGAVIVAQALAELATNASLKPSKRDLLLSATIISIPLIYMAFLWITASNYEASVARFELPYVQQSLYVIWPACAIFAGALLARHTPTGRAMRSWPALLALGAATLVAALVCWSWAEVNPTLLQSGEVAGAIPLLTFLTSHHLPQTSLAGEHVHFDLWLRQIGFATFPWIALIPAALAYLGRSRREEQSPEAHRIERFVLTWAATSAVVMAAASVYGHYTYPAYPPLAIAVGLMLADGAWWRRVARERPFVPYLVGFAAVAIVLMIGKDLERYPRRFVELYTSLDPGAKLPEDFSWSRTYKPLKYAMALALIATFFGPFSWLIITLREVRTWPARWRDWRADRAPLMAPRDPHAPAPMIVRAEQKEALREEPSIWGKIARLIERPSSRGVILVAVFIVCAGLFAWRYMPRATYHFSQRHIFETYVTSAASDQPLWRYLAPEQKSSLYLKDAPTLSNSREFSEKFAAPERFYAVIPRDRLAQVNYDVRRQSKQNVHVLDARSSKLVLLSNQLGPGEQDQNFIADHIVSESDVVHEVTYPGPNDQPQKATLDGQLEFLGYDLNKPVQNGTARYKRGETIELTTYYKVIGRVPGNKKMFLHIDTQGNRLHGDHYPAGGDFPTNYWLPGDVIRDTHSIPIDAYATTGSYVVYVGFFQGDHRMRVQPTSAHDGVNRLKVGTIVIE